MNITDDFVDEPFRNFVLENFCENREFIQKSDVDKIISLNLANQNFYSLKGIEHFTSIEELDCSSNILTELDISKNVNLLTLNCGFNRIRNLDVSQNSMLIKLECYWNILSELNLEQNTNLKELNCNHNSIFSLELVQNSLLTRLDCGSNYLMSLDVNACVSLIEIRCNHNHLTKLVVSQNTALQSLRCFNNHISSLDISNNPLLVELYCSENKISRLETIHNPKLAKLDYSNNLITEPDHEVKGVGTFQYDASLSYYETKLSFNGRELSVSTDMPTKAEMDRLSPTIKKAWEELSELNKRALDHIANLHPDEDVTELVLANLVFEGDTSIKIGYDAGDTPAGGLYIYVEFNEELEMNPELIYETY
ncbi:leucine-rich repeat domain-containing protein [Paenibacillus sp. NPDC058071]|uniref:leucine-rich repeat domain-containing protein n=1 Tax=Paenibacillus sp. NPDC058071 TaxID=3346326 RepID=UPI0036DF752A